MTPRPMNHKEMLGAAKHLHEVGAVEWANKLQQEAHARESYERELYAIKGRNARQVEELTACRKRSYLSGALRLINETARQRLDNRWKKRQDYLLARGRFLGLCDALDAVMGEYPENATVVLERLRDEASAALEAVKEDGRGALLEQACIDETQQVVRDIREVYLALARGLSPDLPIEAPSPTTTPSPSASPDGQASWGQRLRRAFGGNGTPSGASTSTQGCA